MRNADDNPRTRPESKVVTAIPSRKVKIPGILVDFVVLAEQPEPYSAVFSGELLGPTKAPQDMPLDLRKIMARRAALELRAHNIVNLGVGIPECIAEIAAEENVVDLMTLTAEPGVVGGLPESGLNFGAATNAEAVLDQTYQFDFYDGGGLDIAFLATGLVLIEIAPGIDLTRDILSLMDFEPSLSSDLKLMDPRIFGDGPMSLRQELVRAQLPCDAHPSEGN